MHTKSPRHTFAVCAYGQSPYLRACLDSVLSQKGQDSEVYIATSTPSEWLEQIAREYGLQIYINDGEAGIGQDWNFAYAQASGDYVTIAHQDDVYCEDYALTATRMMDESPKPLIFFCDYGELRGEQRITDNRLLRVKRLLLRPLKKEKNRGRRRAKRHALSLGSAICCPSVCISRQACPEPPFKTNMQSNLDWGTWEELSRREGEFCYAPRVLMYHRIHEDSTTSHLIQNNTRAQEDLAMLKRFWPAPIAAIINHFYARGADSNTL